MSLLLIALKSLLIGGISVFALLVLSRCSAAVRHLFCAMAICALATIPFISLSGLQVPVQVPRSEPAIAQVTTPITAVITQNETPPAPLRVVPPVVYAPAEEVRAVTAPAEPLSPTLILVLVWAAGTLLTTMRPLVGAIQAAALIRGAKPVDERLRGLAQEAARRHNLRGPLTVLMSTNAECALAWGYFRPVVILPVGANDWPERDLTTVLLHEFAHLARGDWLAQAFASAVCTLYWFNPFAWAISARLRREAEQAADDLVLRNGVAPEAYAHCLIQIARQVRRRPRPAGVAPILDPSQIEIRIRGIMSKETNRGAVTPLRSLAIAACLASLTLPMAAAFPYRIERALKGDKKAPEVRPSASIEQDYNLPALKPRLSRRAEATVPTDPGEVKPLQAHTLPPSRDTAEAPRGDTARPAQAKATGSEDLELAPYQVDLASIAKRDKYYLRMVDDSYTAVLPNSPKSFSISLDMAGWPIASDRGRQDGGCLAPVNRDGLVLLPGGKTSIEWDRLDVVVLDSAFVALVVPANLTVAQRAAAGRELESQLRAEGDNTPVKVMPINANGYVFLPGNNDYLGKQDARIAAWSLKHRGERPEPPQPYAGLVTQLPPRDFEQVRADTGYIWIVPNTVESRGTRHLISTAVLGYPHQIPSKDGFTGAAGRNGGLMGAANERGYFIRQQGVMNANYENAEVITLNGEYTALIVPDDVEQADIDKTIEEAYRVNKTDAEHSPIKVFRQSANGIIVLPGPEDELVKANRRASNGGVPVLSNFPSLSQFFMPAQVQGIKIPILSDIPILGRFFEPV